MLKLAGVGDIVTSCGECRARRWLGAHIYYIRSVHLSCVGLGEGYIHTEYFSDVCVPIGRGLPELLGAIGSERLKFRLAVSCRGYFGRVSVFWDIKELFQV